MQHLDRLKGMILGLGAGALALLWGAPALAGDHPQNAVQTAIYWTGGGIEVERAGYLGRYRDYGTYRGRGHHARRHAYHGHGHHRRHAYRGHRYKRHHRRHYDDHGYRHYRRGHRRHGGDFCREDHDHHGHRYRRH